MSLTRNTSSNSLQQNSPAPPKKPERSFLEAAGSNTANIYKFDCQLERNPIKHSTGSLDKVGANQTSVTNSTSDQTPEKKKKKAKKEKKDKKEKKEKKKEKEEKSVRTDNDVKTLNNFEKIEKSENSRLEREREDIWSAELSSSDVETETAPVRTNVKVRSQIKPQNNKTTDGCFRMNRGVMVLGWVGHRSKK